jgi:hypothetical protein
VLKTPFQKGEFSEEDRKGQLRKFVDLPSCSDDQSPSDFYIKDRKCVIPALLELEYTGPKSIQIQIQTSQYRDGVIFTELERANVNFPSPLCAPKIGSENLANE